MNAVPRDPGPARPRIPVPALTAVETGIAAGERDAISLLRAFTHAVGRVANAQTPSDVFEGVCRALGDCGITAVALELRGSRVTALTHGPGDIAVPRDLTLPALACGEVARFFGIGQHPLASALPSLPSLVVRVPGTADGIQASISLLSPGLSAAHTTLAEAFATMLHATVARAAVEARLREWNARLEQRVRARTEDLAALYDLSSALITAGADREAAGLAARAAARTLPCDAAAVLLCTDRRHVVSMSARAAMAPGLTARLVARLRTTLDMLSGGTHAGCAAGPLEVVDPPTDRGGIALDGDPSALLEVPVICSGVTAGVAAILNPRGSAANDPPAQEKLLQTIANQLGAAVERLTGARSAERERLSALLEGLSECVVLIDDSGCLLAANAAGRALLAGAADAAGSVAADVVDLARTALAGRDPMSRTITTHGERARTLLAIATGIRDITGEPAAAVTVRDITDETLMRERLFQSEKMASVGQLVSGVAHELNNPLTGILGFAQLLQARGLDAISEHYVQTVHGEAERASKIVQNLLSFARRRPPEKGEVDLNILIGRVLELRAYDLRVHDIQVRLDLTPNLPSCLADPHQIQQVLLNVITNAEHAVRSTAGGGEIAITTASEAESNMVRVTVADSGPGILEEHRRRIFDPFFTTKPVGEGTGLGLTIVYGIVEEHGGRIAVDHRPGGGAVFSIDLPRAPGAAPAAVAGTDADAGGHRRGTVLIVDDEQSIRDLLTAVLEEDGHHVEAVRTGAEALTRASEQSFDAIVTDIRMPEMDGITFYAHLRALAPEAARRIVFTSGDTVSRDTREFIATSGVSFLPKPFKLRAVRDLVRAVVEQGAPPAP